MGLQVIAICECGVNAKISVGSGRLNYKEIEYFPGYCKNCNEVIQINLKDEFSFCKSCSRDIAIPYNDPELIGNIGQEIVSRSFGNVITDGTYYCPSCNNMSLRFLQGQLFWD